jgi:hypothetical protein
MKKILIGVASNHCSNHTRNAIRYLCEIMNIKHINIEQQVIDAVAAILRVSAYELQVNIEQLKPIPLINYSAKELMIKIRAMLCEKNQYFFIDQLDGELNSRNETMMQKLFNGEIVSGIQTEEEADYIRSNGGILLHIIDNNSIEQHAFGIADSEPVILTINSTPSTENQLHEIAMSLMRKFNQEHIQQVA